MPIITTNPAPLRAGSETARAIAVDTLAEVAAAMHTDY
jgi:hypothetical protein